MPHAINQPAGRTQRQAEKGAENSPKGWKPLTCSDAGALPLSEKSSGQRVD